MSKFRFEIARNTPDRVEVYFYKKNNPIPLLTVYLDRASLKVKLGIENHGEDEIRIEFSQDSRKISRNMDKFSIILEQLGFERKDPFYEFHRNLNPVKEKDFNYFLEVILSSIEKLF